MRAFLDHSEGRAQQGLHAADLCREPRVLALSAPGDRPRLLMRLRHDQLGLALRMGADLRCGLLGRHERVGEQFLAAPQLHELLLHLLDLVRELAPLAPDVLEAVGDIVQELLRPAPRL